MQKLIIAASFTILLPGASQAQGGDLCTLAASAGTPQIEGLSVVWMSPLGDPKQAQHWKHIIIHQMEGPPGSARHAALAQAKNPTKRGTTLWVETDGTIYWSVPETAIPTHGDGANRKDNKFIPNFTTYRRIVKDNSFGIEFAGNYPDVRKPPTQAQHDALMKLLPFLQERYRIAPEQIYAHQWIDHKDPRYCEGCELAEAARKMDYRPRCGERAGG
jgi:hypothetical protein